MQEIPVIRRLKPYFDIASDAALASPCIRRQYGAVIVTKNGELDFLARTNSRVSRCCNNFICARDRARLRNGENVEIGAEVHAETAALIDYTPVDGRYAYFLLVGYNGRQELLGTGVYPCHTCAVNLKYAGFNWIYIKDNHGEICPVSISDILEYREAEWEYDG
jgi:dCMP deaminase